MTGSLPAASGRIFISYRREDTAYAAGWLYDRLAERYGASQLFKDVDSIELGDDFVEVITAAVGSCDVLLALIGEDWLTITDAHGRRRLDDPADFVRLEVEAALLRRVRVIPILVEGAKLPHADDLPDSLARLVRREALELSPARFDFDIGRLLKVLDRTLDEVRTVHEEEASTNVLAGKAPEPIRSAIRRRALIGGIAFLGTTAFQTALVLILKVIADASGGGGISRLLREHPRWSLAILLVVSTALTSGMLWLDSRRQDAATRAELVESATRDLATAVRGQLEAETHIRLLESPAAIPMRWQNADDSVVDHWGNVRLDPRCDLPICLDGEWDDIVEVFSRVPSRRLVVLGQAGAGKSVLMAHFMRSTLIESADGDEMRVPVLFALATWDPASAPLAVWLARELATQYPSSGRRLSGGRSLAREMIDSGRILYVLDGLDEMPSQLRGEALDALSRSLRSTDHVLLTSRLPEYRSAVAASGPLARGAAVVVRNLEPSDLRAYLIPSAGDARGSPWTAVLTELETAPPGSPKAAHCDVLRTPLMANMARSIYRSKGSPPQELLSFVEPRQIENLLLDQFVSAVLDPGPGMRRRHRRVRRRTERYLRNIARYMREANTPYFRWWELPKHLSLRARLILGVLVGIVAPLLLSGFPFTVQEMLESRLPWLNILIDLGVLPAVGVLIVVYLHRGGIANPDAPIIPVRLRNPWSLERAAQRAYRADRRRVLLALSMASIIAVPYFLVGAIYTVIEDPSSRAYLILSGLLISSEMFAAIALAIWATLALSDLIEEPIRLSEVWSPASLVRRARWNGLLEALISGVMAIFLSALVYVPFAALNVILEEWSEGYDVPMGFEWWLNSVMQGLSTPDSRIFMPIALIMLLVVTPWGRFALARLYFGCTRKFPFRLMAFLATAHRLGLLRQTGPAFQFRHLKLRDRVAQGRPTRE